MITLAEWKLIGIVLFGIFFILAIVLGIISEIATRIKNKEPKKMTRKIIHPTYKFDICEFVATEITEEFIGYRKMLINEFVNM